MQALRRTLVAALAAGLLSAGLIGGAAAQSLTNHVWYYPPGENVSAWYAGVQHFSCPDGQHMGHPDYPYLLPFTNYSPTGVSVSLFGGGYGSDHIDLLVTNWTPSGRQFTISYVCH